LYPAQPACAQVILLSGFCIRVLDTHWFAVKAKDAENCFIVYLARRYCTGHWITSL